MLGTTSVAYHKVLTSLALPWQSSPLLRSEANYLWAFHGIPEGILRHIAKLALQLLELGVDAITTNVPKEISALLR